VTDESHLAPEVLALLCCPTTRQPLHLATPAELAAMQPSPAAALVREDRRAAYPILDGIPILIAEEAIPLGAA
jgi:uncharacterized protein YbaR (Trm112 family)